MNLIRLAVLMALPAGLLLAQQPPAAVADGGTIAVDVRLVALTAIVRNKEGGLVLDLNKDDFKLYDNDVLQKVSYFNRDSDLPLTIGLMVDTSGSLRQYAEEERRASLTFLRSMVTRPQDRAFLERFDTKAILLQPMTSNMEFMEHALTLLTSAPPPPIQKGRTTVLYDAIRGTVLQVMGKETGRRALIVMTDGIDEGSKSRADEAVLYALHADTVVYTVLYNKNYLGSDVMGSISKYTGGRLFVVSKEWPIERIYAEIERELRSQYRFGFTPPPSPPLTYHRLELKARDRHLTVQTRSGYFSPEK